MSTIRATLVFHIITVFSALSAAAGENPWDAMKTPFKSAVVHYDVSGNQKGTETLYIRSHGKETAKVTKSSGKIMFMNQSTNTIQITTPDELVTIDMDKKSGTRVTNPQKYMIEEYEKLSAKDKAVVKENIEKMGVSGLGMFKSMGGEMKKQAGEHLGYKCDVVTFMGSKVSQMSGTAIPLKSEMSMMGVTINTVATRVEENAAPPDSVFQPPAGVEVVFDKKTDDMNREMARSMIDWLRDPESGKQMDQMEKDMAEAQKEAEQERAGKPGEKEAAEPAGGEEDKSGDMMKKGMDVFKGIFK